MDVQRNAAAEPAWARYLDDPIALADASTIEAFSIPQEGLDQIHLRGLQRRFRELRTKIAALDRLATEQGISAISAIDDVVPLLFPHTFYKSYAYSHLEKGRYDRLNAWLQELTSCDLSGVDSKSCTSIESWMESVEAVSPVQCLTTSGTSGKISFVPRTRREWPRSVISFFVRFHQGFHGERNQDLTLEDLSEIPIFFPNLRHGRHTQHRIVDTLAAMAYGDREDMVMALYPDRMDLDVLLLAGRVAAADAIGRKVEIPPALAAKRDVFAAQQAAMAEQARTFYERVLQRHAGKRVTSFCTWGSLYDAATQARASGRTHVFHPDSLIVTGGGMKGRVLPPDWYQVICEFLGKEDVRDGYGCSEQHFAAARCGHGHYHLHPMNVSFLLDPDTGEALPRTGTRTGRFAFHDLAAETYWGGFITGDEVTVTWDEPCLCGRTGPYAHREIRRYSEKHGGDDKINCAGVPQAHQRALDAIIAI
jgi:hypothetical protein